MSFITPPHELASEPVPAEVSETLSKVSEAPGERELWPTPVEGGSAAQFMELLRYLTQTDVHTYAFSVAANVILSLFPFIVLLLTLSRNVFHSAAMAGMVGELMHSYLPTGQDFVMRNMNLLAHPHKGVQIFSVVMLFISSTGVFLPLEVALNNVWRAPKNRSYLGNQIVSLGLAIAVGLLAMFSVGMSTAQRSVLGIVFFGHTDNMAYTIISNGFLSVVATLCSIAIFFLIYWVLPNRKIPAMAVLPTAIVTGLLWEGAKFLYIFTLPHLDLENVYGPFQISVGLMLWAFLSGLMLLAGAHFSATRHGMRMATLQALQEAK
jgi:YihY family inner membrane protein